MDSYRTDVKARTAERTARIYIREKPSINNVLKLFVANRMWGDWHVEALFDEIPARDMVVRERNLDDIIALTFFCANVVTTSLEYTNGYEIIFTPLLGVESDGSADTIAKEYHAVIR